MYKVENIVWKNVYSIRIRYVVICMLVVIRLSSINFKVRVGKIVINLFFDGGLIISGDGRVWIKVDYFRVF